MSKRTQKRLLYTQWRCVRHIRGMTVNIEERKNRIKDKSYYRMAEHIVIEANRLKRALINSGEETDAGFNDFLDLAIEKRTENASPDIMKVLEAMFDGLNRDPEDETT